MPVDVRDALHAVIDARRDIRRYRADPSPMTCSSTDAPSAAATPVLSSRSERSASATPPSPRPSSRCSSTSTPTPSSDLAQAPTAPSWTANATSSPARSPRNHRETSRPVDALAALAAVGGPELAVLTGATIGAAASRTPVVLDGLAVSVAALTATLLEPAAQHCLIAGQRSREAAHPLVLEALGCEPLLDLRIRSGEGAGAALACGLLLNAPPCPPRNSTHHPYLTDDRPRVPQHAARARPDPAANYGEVATGGVGPVGAPSRWVPFGLTQPAR